MTYFDRTRVSPADAIWDQPAPAADEKAPPPGWSALTHPVLAPPAGARPFYLAGSRATAVVPFFAEQVPGCELVIGVGEVCVVKNLLVAFDVTLNPDNDRYWSLQLDGVPVGQGFGAAKMFGTGWTTTNGVVLFPVDLRITVSGTLRLTVTDNTAPGPARVFAGILQGWLYPSRFDAGIDSNNP